MFIGFLTRRGMRPTELIQRSGFHRAQVEEWLSGSSEPTQAQLRDMAIALLVSVRELIAPLEAPTPPVPLNMIRTTLPPVSWTDERSLRWGALPFAHWGYLRLQTTAGSKIFWYPVTAMQAAELDDAIARNDRSAMIVSPTANNRVLLFAMARMCAAEVIEAGAARRRTDFEVAWDGTGMAPELYRALREWTQIDAISLSFMTSAETGERVADMIELIGLRRRQLQPRLVDTIIDHVDGRRLRLEVSECDLRSAVRSVSLGALTVGFTEQEGTRELLLPLDCVRLIDLPATDLGLVPTVIAQDRAQGGQDDF